MHKFSLQSVSASPERLGKALTAGVERSHLRSSRSSLMAVENDAPDCIGTTVRSGAPAQNPEIGGDPKKINVSSFPDGSVRVRRTFERSN